MCTPSITCPSRPAALPAIRLPPDASARSAPRSSSSSVAATVCAAEPGRVTSKIAFPPSASASSEAPSVTACHTLQFAGVKTSVPPPWIEMSASPETRVTVAVVFAAGATANRTKNRPSPFSRTFTLVELTMVSGETSNEFVTTGAAFQLPSPSCDATMLTRPAPVKVRLVDPARIAGPALTANATGRPLDAVADSPTASLSSLSPMAGNSIVCSPLSTTNVATIVRGLLVAPAAVTRTVAECVPTLSPVRATAFVSTAAPPVSTVPDAGDNDNQPDALAE